MKPFFLGFLAGAATYHFVLGPPNEELISDLRDALKKVDERLAETEKADMPTPEPPTAETP